MEYAATHNFSLFFSRKDGASVADQINWVSEVPYRCGVCKQRNENHKFSFVIFRHLTHFRSWYTCRGFPFWDALIGVECYGSSTCNNRVRLLHQNVVDVTHQSDGP